MTHSLLEAWDGHNDVHGDATGVTHPGIVGAAGARLDHWEPSQGRSPRQLQAPGFCTHTQGSPCHCLWLKGRPVPHCQCQKGSDSFQRLGLAATLSLKAPQLSKVNSFKFRF